MLAHAISRTKPTAPISSRRFRLTAATLDSCTALEACGPVRVGLGIRRGERGRRLIEFRLRLLRTRRPGNAAEDQPVAAAAAAILNRQRTVWQPHFAFGQRELEARRQYPDHLVRLVVESERSTHDRRVAAEPGSPGVVVQHRGFGGTAGVLAGREAATDDRLHAQHRKEICGHEPRAQSIRFSDAGQIRRLRAHQAQAGDVVQRRAQVLIIGNGQELVGAGAIDHRQHHDTIGIFVRQRPQHDGIHHGEDRRVGADGQDHRDRNHDRERALLAQGANGMTNIVDEERHRGVSSGVVNAKGETAPAIHALCKTAE